MFSFWILGIWWSHLYNQWLLLLGFLKTEVQSLNMWWNASWTLQPWIQPIRPQNDGPDGKGGTPGLKIWPFLVDSLKLTANAPENRVSQKEISLPTIHFQVLCWFQGGYVRFLGCRFFVCLSEGRFEKILFVQSSEWGPLQRMISNDQITSYHIHTIIHMLHILHILCHIIYQSLLIYQYVQIL